MMRSTHSENTVKKQTIWRTRKAGCGDGSEKDNRCSGCGVAPLTASTAMATQIAGVRVLTDVLNLLSENP